MCSEHVAHVIMSARVGCGVQMNGTDAYALGGAKVARWKRVLCMLVLAAADARFVCAIN